MNYTCLTIGAFQTNSYILQSDKSSKDCVIIDTGLGADQLINFIIKQDLNPVALLLTHGHVDHIQGVTQLKENWPDIMICVHYADAEMLTCSEKNLSQWGGYGAEIVVDSADIQFQDKDVLEFANISFRVIHTPGHTQGCVCFYCESEGILFCGDTIFAGSIGRTDFPGYNPAQAQQQLVDNVIEKVWPLPLDTKLLCGHGPATTIRCEKKHNPILGQNI